MFRPSARRTYSSAMSTMRTQALPWVCNSSGRASRSTAEPMKTAIFLVESFMVRDSSGAIGHTFAQQARRAHRERQDQDDEGEDVAVLAAQHAARHRPQVTRTHG